MTSAILKFPGLLSNFHWFSFFPRPCFPVSAFRVSKNSRDSLPRNPRQLHTTYLELSCWNKFPFTNAIGEPVNGHEDYCVSYCCEFQGIHTTSIIYLARWIADCIYARVHVFFLVEKVSCGIKSHVVETGNCQPCLPGQEAKRNGLCV